MSRAGRLDDARERLLVLRARSGDKRAFHDLVKGYERRLAYYVNRMVGPTVDTFDVLQEIWLIVHRRLATLQATEAFRVWLYKIAHDVTVSQYRKAVRRDEVEASVEPDEIEEWDEFEALANAELVHRTPEQLTDVHREVLSLRFLEELELSEIAAITGCEIGTVKSRLHYAKRALKEKIGGTDE